MSLLTLRINTVEHLSCVQLEKARKKDIGKMLLEREDITPNILDTNGRTPLSRAARKWYEDIVKMLLSQRMPLPTLQIMAAERLPPGRLGFDAGASSRRFWNGKIPLQTLEMKTVKHLSCERL